MPTQKKVHIVIRFHVFFWGLRILGMDHVDQQNYGDSEKLLTWKTGILFKTCWPFEGGGNKKHLFSIEVFLIFIHICDVYTLVFLKSSK